MCNLVSCDHNSGGSGFDVVDAAKAVVLIAAFGGGVAVISLAPVPLFVAYLFIVAVTVAFSSARVRRYVWKPLVMWLQREMWRTWTTRNDRPTFAAAPRPGIGDRTWHVTLQAKGQPAISGSLTGPWSSRRELEAEARLRYRERTGYKGRLKCRAKPLEIGA